MADNYKGTLFLKHAQLLISFPDGKTENVVLVDDMTQIGRDENNSFVTPAAFKSISRQHLEIRRIGGQYIVMDSRGNYLT